MRAAAVDAGLLRSDAALLCADDRSPIWCPPPLRAAPPRVTRRVHEERMRQRKQHARNLRVASISSLRRLRILAYAGRTRRGHERQRLLSPTVHYKELVCILCQKMRADNSRILCLQKAGRQVPLHSSPPVTGSDPHPLHHLRPWHRPGPSRQTVDAHLDALHQRGTPPILTVHSTKICLPKRATPPNPTVHYKGLVCILNLGPPYPKRLYP